MYTSAQIISIMNKYIHKTSDIHLAGSILKIQESNYIEAAREEIENFIIKSQKQISLFLIQIEETDLVLLTIDRHRKKNYYFDPMKRDLPQNIAVLIGTLFSDGFKIETRYNEEQPRTFSSSISTIISFINDIVIANKNDIQNQNQYDSKIVMQLRALDAKQHLITTGDVISRGIYVRQARAALVIYNQEKELNGRLFLATHGMGPCVGFTIFVKTEQATAIAVCLAHIDSDSLRHVDEDNKKIQYLELYVKGLVGKILKELKIEDTMLPSLAEVKIITSSSHNTATREPERLGPILLNYAKELGGNVTLFPAREGLYSNENICINLLTGEIKNYIETREDIHQSNSRAELNLSGISAKTALYSLFQGSLEEVSFEDALTLTLDATSEEKSPQTHSSHKDTIIQSPSHEHLSSIQIKMETSPEDSEKIRASFFIKPGHN